MRYNLEQDSPLWTGNETRLPIYYESAHSIHFVKVGQSWWADLEYAQAYEISRFGVRDNRSPYGTGDDGFLSDYISLAESWAEHVGQTIADRIYGANSSRITRQDIGYANDAPIFGLSSHLNYLEDFSPFRTGDPFHWIPDGIYNDLIDDRNDNLLIPRRVLIDDAVSGYTNQQMYNALEEDVKSLVQYRVRLLNQNGNNQSAGVTQLFNQYGY